MAPSGMNSVGEQVEKKVNSVSCLVSILISVLGETHWLKLPALARYHRNPFVGVILRQEVLARNMELISYHQPEEFAKGQNEMPCILSPPRILPAGIHLSWAMCAPPGRTLSQNNWLKTTQKLTPSPENLSLWATCQSPPGLPYHTVLHRGAPSQ